MKELEPLFLAIVEIIDSRYLKLSRAGFKNFNEYNLTRINSERMVEVKIELKNFCGTLNEISKSSSSSLIERILLLEKAVGINLIISDDKNQ